MCASSLLIVDGATVHFCYHTSCLHVHVLLRVHVHLQIFLLSICMTEEQVKHCSILFYNQSILHVLTNTKNLNKH